MKYFASIMAVGLILAGCAQWFVEPYPDLLETERPLVSGCRMIGVLAETADAANPFSLAATENMKLRVRERAGMLGATHIVWLHQTPDSATAQAYQCPQP